MRLEEAIKKVKVSYSPFKISSIYDLNNKWAFCMYHEDAENAPVITVSKKTDIIKQMQYNIAEKLSQGTVIYQNQMRSYF